MLETSIDGARAVLINITGGSDMSIMEINEAAQRITDSADPEANIIFGAGDLYVTIYGGRTRMIGTLLGRGMRFEEALAELHGVTLESLVIATRAANAIRHRIERGELRAESFPLLLHCDDVINHDKPAGDIPWDAFEEDWEL